MPAALVKSAKGTSSAATVAWAFGSATTSGNLIVGLISSDDYNSTPDSGWTQSTGMEVQDWHGGYIWWRISTGETTPQAYTIGSATTSAWQLLEFSGIDAAPYDISASQSENNVGGSSYTTPSITPSTGGRLLVAMLGSSKVADMTGCTTSAWTNSFTRVDDAGTSGNGVHVGSAYRLVTGNGSTGFSTGADYSVTVLGSKSGLIIAFKESTGGGSTQAPRSMHQFRLRR